MVYVMTKRRWVVTNMFCGRCILCHVLGPVNGKR